MSETYDFETHMKTRGRESEQVAQVPEHIPPPFSEEALALQFADQHEGDLRYVASWSKWMIFDGARWTPDNTRLAFNMARAICREAAAECDKPNIKTILASAKTRAAVITLANDDRRLAATTMQWDADPNALNTPRGPLP